MKIDLQRVTRAGVDGAIYALILGNEEYFFNDLETAEKAYNRILSVSEQLKTTHKNLSFAKGRGDSSMVQFFSRSAWRMVEDLENYLQQFCGIRVRFGCSWCLV